ncbi:BTAD domain-containing putative transcriptional regulator [Arabiibacter massiliensis]|uniref:BTAD domain-containing putative transcriptional regulator n=1 Tax=Arabiibacter massiliensis TaxID=1870985 RepID=UPI0009B999D7|nr:BTAD domain-containing putative transcriptional regulator [Arabiibacter massiliensis]
MPDYLAKASCRGRRPQNLASRRLFPRPDLIARLLRERHVARFVVAPGGYGKTALALMYADTVFHFEHVFWLDGKSPCFLRDLDRGIVGSTLLESDPMPFLAVLEDVPPLDPERLERLSADMDLMLDRGCEVLVTCVPTCDAFARHRDRVKLSAADLLLADDEIDAPRTEAERASAPASAIARSERAAGLVWREQGGAGFLEGALREELPSDLLLPMLAMLVLGEGSFADIAVFGPFEADQAEFFAGQYPHLGVDVLSGRFSTARFEVEEIARAFSPKLDLLARRSPFPGRDALVTRMADALMARGRPERACATACGLGSRAACAAWLADRGTELLEAACVMPACEAYRALGGETAGRGPRLDVDEACRRAALGDGPSACSAARRVAGNPSAAKEERAVAALVLASCAEGRERRRACDVVASLARSAGGPARGEAEEWMPPAVVRTALDSSCEKGAETWLAWYEGGARGPAVAQAAAWVLDRAAEDPRFSGRGFAGEEAVERVASIVRSRVSRAASIRMGLLDAVAGTALEHACESGAVSSPTLDTRAAHAVHGMEMALFKQRVALARLDRQRSEIRRSFAATHPDARWGDSADAGLPAVSASEPLLTVNLFGGLDVRIGDEPVDAVKFRRQKVKTLLALLVLNRGKEFSRDKLVSILWPDSELAAARKNFYSIWSMLRRALTAPDGSCPYLIRQQNGLRLDARLLSTDVTQLEGVCRTLLFEQPGYGGWAQLFAQVNEKFSEDLLPSEDDNGAIAAMRADYRNRLVDALVGASTRLVAAGEAQEGLWFARAALQRDRMREDAYTTLMRAQIAAGQRTAALDTYFSCRRFLADELGIDPSLETMELYRSIIETEAVLEDY